MHHVVGSDDICFRTKRGLSVAKLLSKIKISLRVSWTVEIFRIKLRTDLVKTKHRIILLAYLAWSDWHNDLAISSHVGLAHRVGLVYQRLGSLKIRLFVVLSVWVVDF